MFMVTYFNPLTSVLIVHKTNPLSQGILCLVCKLPKTESMRIPLCPFKASIAVFIVRTIANLRNYMMILYAFCRKLSVFQDWTVNIQCHVSCIITLDRENITDILQSTFSNVFSWKQIIVFTYRFHGNLFTWARLKINKSALVQIMTSRHLIK